MKRSDLLLLEVCRREINPPSMTTMHRDGNVFLGEYLMASVSQVESVDFDVERYNGVPQVYVIASQPRSGSHYLAQLLRSTGEAGVPLEYFHHDHWKRWAKRCQRSNPLAVYRLLCQLRTTPNGVFGFKAHWKQFQWACTLRLEKELIGAKFIEISRDDLLGQAISLVIASQTGAWIFEHEVQRRPEYSFAAIERAIDRLIVERGNWSRFFALTGIEPLRVSYEQLCSERDATMQRVCLHLGIQWVEPDSVEMHIQRTELSDLWRQRFLDTLPKLHEENGLWRARFGSS